MGDELDVVAGALAVLGHDPADAVVLADHPGRRRVVRSGDTVVKAFAAAEDAAWRRERAGLEAVAGTGVGAELVASGAGWTAVRWIEGVVPMDTDADDVEVHEALGRALAGLHGVAPAGLSPWPVAERLRRRLYATPRCPPPLLGAVRRLTEPLLDVLLGGTFVHGDWGTANVLVPRGGRGKVLAVIDFEDSHEGDAAEDFKWQVLAGPASPALAAMSRAYAAAGGSLGAAAAERLVVCGVECCLDVLSWDLPPSRAARYHDRCLRTLRELVDGAHPSAP